MVHLPALREAFMMQNYAQGTVVKGGSYGHETVEFMQNYCADGYTATSENGMVVVSKN